MRRVCLRARARVSVCLCVCLSVCVYVSACVFVSFGLSVVLSVCLSVFLSVCLSVCLSEKKQKTLCALQVARGAASRRNRQRLCLKNWYAATSQSTTHA